ncbi:MAG: ABC transporter substrate-binding protein [Pseudomonadota bacterium]
MRRRAVLGFAAAALALPSSLFAQQAGRIYRIGLLQPGSPTPEALKFLDQTFHQTLRERGWIEGKNIVYEQRWAELRPERFPELAADLVQLKVDVIVAVINSAVAAAKNLTQSIPIVAVFVNEPVRQGFAQSYARPGGNVTGLTAEAGPTIDTKSFELLKEAAPAASRIAVLAGPGRTPYLEVIPPVAKSLNVELLVVEANKLEDIEGAFARMKEGRANAVFVPGVPLYLAHRVRIAELALQHRLPMGGPVTMLAEAGGLIGYGIDLAQNWRRAADYVDKILKGAKPGDLPFEQPTKFQLTVNLTTAKALGLTIPQVVLLRADRVIE